MTLAIVGGEARRFEPFVELYQQAFQKLGRPVQPIGVHSLGYVAEEDSLARDAYWPALQADSRSTRFAAWLAADRASDL